jgi:tRNA (cmo5U34)-methyltransferase
MASASRPSRHVAAHLGIRLSEYDERIRTFIPRYEEMLAAAAASVGPDTRRIVDLGIGTGALAMTCLARASRATVTGIDADGEILALAAGRLGARATLVCGSFLHSPFPPADAIVSSFALHHVRTRDAKLRLYRRVRAALRRGGVFVSADCHPASDSDMAAAQMQAWRAHVRRTYRPARTAALFRSWGREDVYTPLDAELALLERAGLTADVTWRRDGFAVLVAARSRSTEDRHGRDGDAGGVAVPASHRRRTTVMTSQKLTGL